MMRITIINRTGRATPPDTRARLTELFKRAGSKGVIPSWAEEVNLAFVGEEEMRDANRRFRRKNRPTDVLSFPNEDKGPLNDGSLGDIMIALDVARRQASDFGTTLRAEIERLTVHGLLHLCGHDHHSEKDRLEMERLEDLILERGGRAC